MAGTDILDGTVDDLHAALQDYEGDLMELLEAEKEGKNRSTAIAAIEEEIRRRAETPPEPQEDAADGEGDQAAAGAATRTGGTEEQDILAGSVDDLRAALPDYDGDLHELVAAEHAGKDRSTAIQAIEEEMERRGEDGSGEPGTDEDDDGGFSMASIRERIQQRLHATTKETRDMVFEADGGTWIRTGVPGFDDLFEHGIPRGSPILLAGGAGAGKTIFTLQLAAAHASHGQKVMYMSFEESVDALKEHMQSFGWDPEPLIAADTLRIVKYSPFDISRKVEAVLAKQKGELMIDVDPVIFPEDFEPDVVVVDSLTAVASAFTADDRSYRIYIDTLFNFFEDIDATSFLITETGQEPDRFSPSGVEEFLADGVIVMYNFRKGDVREKGIEVLKMRGASHKRNMAAMQISDNGIRVYPDQSVFGAMRD